MKIIIICFLTILLLVGCSIQDNTSTDDISDDATTVVETEDIVDTESPVTATVEKDGNSGADAPDKFADGQIELTPGEYTSNALIRNDNFDDTSDDIDFYKFTIAAGDWFKLTVTPVQELDTLLYIHDAGGKEKTWDYTYYYLGNPAGQAVLKLNSGIAGKEESFWSQMSTEEESYTYYFSVQSVGGTGAYTIQLETKQQNDGDSGKDTGEKPAKAVSLDAGKEYSGLLNFNDIMDCYKLTTGGEATVTVTPTEKLNPSFTVHDEGGKDKTWDLTYYKNTNKKQSLLKVNDADTGLPESITWKTTASTQYICIKKESGFGDYTISYS